MAGAAVGAVGGDAAHQEKQLGLDKVRCGAAFHYANAVLDQPRRVSCAIITVPVSHKNTRTIPKNGAFTNAGYTINDWIMSPNASAADANWRDFVEGQKALSRILIAQNCLGNGGNLVWPRNKAERAICCPRRCGGCADGNNGCAKADKTCCTDHILRVYWESLCLTNSSGADATPCTYDVDQWGYTGVYQFGASAPPARARVKRNTKPRAHVLRMRRARAVSACACTDFVCGCCFVVWLCAGWTPAMTRVPDQAFSDPQPDACFILNDSS